MKNAKAGKGNVERLIAALRILLAVPEAHYSASAVDFGKPIVFTKKGPKAGTKANALAWLAQSILFKSFGIDFVLRPGSPGWGYQPCLALPHINSKLYGVSAIANVLGLEWSVAHRVFADGSLKEVIRRLRIATTKAGGAGELKKFDDSMKPPVVKKPAKKKVAKKKVAKKKAAKKPAKKQAAKKK